MLTFNPAVKRRFIRQNREIARVNSNQSVRIRNLETEISRLLAENIAIREEAINARAQAEKWKTAHRLSKEVARVKDLLEEKLSEVNALVGELDTLPEKVARRSSQRRRKDGFVSELINTTEEKEPRQRRTIVEQEGTLPVIVEDKYYPRRTLDPSEINTTAEHVVDDPLESPDIGPPPVAHFEDPEAPLAFKPTKSPRRTSSGLTEENESAQKPSSTTLESRRKRRTSTLLQSSALEGAAKDVPKTTEIASREPQKKDAVVQLQSILKSGAKRKLEVSELEDTSRISKELDEFIFQRKGAASNTAARPSRFSRPPGRQVSETADPTAPQSPSKTEQPVRRILAPKSANSPAKRRIESSLGKASEEKDKIADVKPEKRLVSRMRTKPTHIAIPPPSNNNEPGSLSDDPVKVSIEQVDLPPKTPAGDVDDLLSPISTEPSKRQTQSREITITNSVEDVLNGSIGRGSRRARAAINYAQPKLNTKMRRPGKELVGAVEGITRLVEPSQTHYRGNSIGLELDAAGGESGNDDAANVKYGHDTSAQGQVPVWEEFGIVQGGKSEPASPLRDKRPTTMRLSNHDEEELSRTASKLSVFDPPTSSPILEKTFISNEMAAPPDSILRSRRHSIQSEPAKERPSAISHSGGLKTRRPNSALGIRQSEQPAMGEQIPAKGHSKKAASVSSLPSTSQLNIRGISARQAAATAAAPTDAADLVGQGNRSSALTRRRSMMV